MEDDSDYLGRSSAMKISELIAVLQNMLDQYGDLPVFSAADYGWVRRAERLCYTDSGWEWAKKYGDHIRLQE